MSTDQKVVERQDAAGQPIKAISISARNSMGCSLAEYRFNEALNVVGGDNANGKTSFIRSFLMVVGGAREFPPEPIKIGEESSDIVLRLTGNESTVLPWPCTVTRSFRRKKSGKGFTTELVITADDGEIASSPQGILDDLVTKGLGFDPLKFIAAKPQDQVDILKRVVGLDFTDIDEERKQHYERRTVVGREIKAIEGSIKKMEYDPNARTERIDVSEQFALLEKHRNHNSAVKKARGDVERIGGECQKVQKQIEELEKTLEGMRKDLSSADQKVKDLGEPFGDIDEIKGRIEKAEQVNRVIDMNQKRFERIEERQAKEREKTLLTDEITKIDRSKAKMMEDADWPVDGLEFGEHGVYHQGVPIIQKSAKEQRELAIMIGAALNPDFPFLIVWDGSLFDKKAMKHIAEFCSSNGIQVLMERVSKGNECNIVFEEGFGEDWDDEKAALALAADIAATENEGERDD